MIRNFKKIIKNKLLEFKFTNYGNNFFKAKLASNLEKVKLHINRFRIQKSENLEPKYNTQNYLNDISNDKIKNHIHQLALKETNKKEINENNNKNKKFLKKKLKRKLSRIKRKIKRYKFTELNQTDTNNQIKLMTDNIENKENTLDVLNSKIKTLHLELLKIQSTENNNLESGEIKKLKNKYKKKIKKLRNKLNKFSKAEIQKNNIIELKNDNEAKIIINSKILEKNKLLEIQDDPSIELQNELEKYKNENQSLLAKLKELESNQVNDESYKLKYEELELKLKHYQEENLRLSNNILQHEKKIEIMKNQIDNFENLKQKLYEQVNNLGDTLLNNDNVENLFTEKISYTEENKAEIKKIVNADELDYKIENTASFKNDEHENKSANLTNKDLDNYIKEIFSN